MNKGGTGIGSASLVLIFAVLCLTIFALISFTDARADKIMTDTGAKLVKDYYEADMLAELILAEILKTGTVPANINGIDIATHYDQHTRAEIVAFSCPLSDRKNLQVELAIFEDTYDILKWSINDTKEWEINRSLPVWHGQE